MPSHRAQHNSESVKREISAIIRELKDPRVTEGFIGIVKIDMAGDMSSCKVYVSSIHGIDIAKEAVKGLNSAKGYVRKILGNRLRLRYIPAIEFCATDSVEYGVHIMKTIDELKGGRNNEVSESDCGDTEK